MKEGYQELLSSRSGFLPKTQAQALAALSEGLVDEAIFVWKAVNIHPVFEEPWDFNDIEVLLSKEDLDLGTTVLLMTIFERLIHDPDKEAALFAAESINAVERRFAKKTARLRAKVAASGAAEASREAITDLAAHLRDFGRVFFARPELKRFYLREALDVIGSLEDGAAQAETAAAGEKSIGAIAPLQIEVLLELGEHEEAAELIAAALALDPENPDLLFLAARARFLRRDWRGVATFLEAASAAGEDADRGCGEFATLRDFWTGGACRE